MFLVAVAVGKMTGFAHQGDIVSVIVTVAVAVAVAVAAAAVLKEH